MKKVAINIDEITLGLANTHLTTLQKAAEISPLITERTIGPDLEPWDKRLAEINNQNKAELKGNTKDEKENQNRSNRAKSEPAKTPEKMQIITKKPPGSNEILKNRTNFLEASSSENISLYDSELLEETVYLKEKENKRLKSMRQQIFEKQKEDLDKTLEFAEVEQMVLREDFKEKFEKASLNVDDKDFKEKQHELEQVLDKVQRDIFEARSQSDRRIHMLVLQGISKYQIRFRTKYEGIAKLLMSNKDSLQSCQEYNMKLKQLVVLFDKLIGQMRSGQVGTKELISAEKLCKSLEEIESSLIKDVKIVRRHESEFEAAQKQKMLEMQKAQQQKAKEQLEQQKLQQQQQADKLKALQDSQEQQALLQQNEAQQQLYQSQEQTQSEQQPLYRNETDSTTSSSSGGEAPFNRQKLYEEVMTFYRQKQQNVKPFQNDETCTKYRNTCQRIVNTPINAISNINGAFLRDKFEKITKFFNGNPQKTSLGDITINNHPLARDFCTLLMAKTFVGKGYLEISSNPTMAFSVASVIVAIWKLYPDFGKLYLANTFKESPLLAPVFIPRRPEQTDQEYLSVMGYHFDKNGKMEDEAVFLKRQGGIARLYGAIMITNGKESDHHVPHPYGLDQAWLWLVNFLMLEPFPSLSANTLLEMLQIISADLCGVYGRQFIKLLIYIQQHYMPKLNAIDQGGPKVRLEMLLDTYLKEGIIQKPKGIMPPNFW